MGATTLTASAEEVAADPSRIITILSPKGGAGKTSSATNLAVGLAKRYPREVVLVDLDLQFGDVVGGDLVGLGRAERGAQRVDA